MKKLIEYIYFKLYISKTLNELDKKQYIENYLKNKQYVKDGNRYIKEFVCVELNKENIIIYHDISNSVKRTFDYSITEFIICENYMQRI